VTVGQNTTEYSNMETGGQGNRFVIALVLCTFLNAALAQSIGEANRSKRPKHAMPMPGMQVGSKTHTPAAALRDTFVAGWNARQIANVVSLYSESAVVILPNGMLLTGRQSIGEYLQQISTRISHVSLTSLGSDSSGDLQLDFGNFVELRSEPAADHTDVDDHSSSAQEITGRYLMVMKRVGSDWKIAEQVFVLSSNREHAGS
jgi:ketosteroid isomerase-like protein